MTTTAALPQVAEDKKVAVIVASLRDRIETPVDDATLTEVVRADFRRYDRVKIRDFVPALVERDVRERLLRRPSTSTG
jgi:hypothetical protein